MYLVDVNSKYNSAEFCDFVQDVFNVFTNLLY